MNNSYESVSNNASLSINNINYIQNSNELAENYLIELEDVLPIRQPKILSKNSRKQQISDYEFHLEESHLTETIKYAYYALQPALRKEFREDPKMGFYAKLLRGNETQVESAEAKQDEYVDDRYKEALSNIYEASLKLKDNENRIYIGKRDLHYYRFPHLDVHSTFSEYGRMYSMSRFGLSKLSEEQASSLEEIRSYKIGNGRNAYQKELLEVSVDYANGKKNYEADQRLIEVIEFNRLQNRNHDIFQTISQRQFEISDYGPEQNLLVFGCAGSGKTVLIFNRIAALDYRYTSQGFSLDRTYLITPNNLISQFNKDLIEEQNLKRMHQYEAGQFFWLLFKQYYSNVHAEYNENSLVDNDPDLEFYHDVELGNELCSKVENILNDPYTRLQYENNVHNKIGEKQAQIHLEIYERWNATSLAKVDYADIYDKAKKECLSITQKNIEAAIDKVSKDLDDIAQLQYLRDWIFRLDQIHLFSKYEFSDSSLLDESVSLDNLENQKSDSEGKSLSKTAEKLLENLNPLIQLLNLLPVEIADKGYDSFLFLLESKDQILSIIEADPAIQEFFNKDAEGVYQLLNQSKKMIKNKEKLDYENEALLFLWNHKEYLGKEHKMRHGEIDASYRTFLSNTLTFFKAMNWNSKLDEFEQAENPFLPFEQLERLDYSEERWLIFSNFRRDEQVLFDIIQRIWYEDVLNVEWNIEDAHPVESEANALMHVFILSKIKGSLSILNIDDQEQELCNGENYFFLDEFQDLSLLEINTLRQSIPNLVLNMFGDCSQCINPKGIKDTKIIDTQLPENFIRYELMENYRNARDITNFVNNALALNMQAIGLQGTAKRIKHASDIQLKDLTIDPDGKVAIIVKNKQEADLSSFAHLGAVEYQEKFKNEILKLKRPVIYEVGEVKGLEFENVIVANKGMSRNERYVSYTRAIKKLFVIDGKN